MGYRRNKTHREKEGCFKEVGDLLGKNCMNTLLE